MCSLQLASCDAVWSHLYMKYSRQIISHRLLMQVESYGTDGWKKMFRDTGVRDACMPGYPPVYLSAYPPDYLPAYLPVYLPAYLPAYLSAYLPAYLPACLPASLPA